MPLKPAQKKIGETTYEYTPQRLTPATEIASLVTKHIGEPLVPLLAGGLDTDISGAQLERVGASIVAKLGDSALVLDLVRRLNQGGKAHFKGVDGKPKTLALYDDDAAELFFADRPDEVLPWVAFALEMQVGPFFVSVPRLLGLDHEKTKKLITFAKKFAADRLSRRASSSEDQSSDSPATDDGMTASQ